MDIQKTIKKRAEEYGTSDRGYDPEIQDAYEAGATSILPALKILAKAISQSQAHAYYCSCINDGERNPDPYYCIACIAISQVKALGLWPLPDAGKGGG